MNHTLSSMTGFASRFLSRIRLADAVIAIAFVAALVSFLLFVDRGLDITDEGLYLISAKYPADVWASSTDYHLYLGWLYRLSGESVIGLRLCGVILLLASAVVATWGVEVALRATGLQRGRVLSGFGLAAFLGLGALLYYTRGAPTPGYNLLTSFATYVVMGLLLIGLGQEADVSARSVRRLAPFFGVGAMAGLAFFAKFPAGIVLAALASTAVLIWPTSHRGARLRALVAILVGIACWVMFHLLVASDPAEWWRRVRLGLELVRLSGRGYEPSTLIYGYAYRLYEVARYQVAAYLWPAFVLSIVAVGAIRLGEARASRFPRMRLLALAALGCAFGYMLWEIVTLGWYRGGHKFTSTFFAPYLALSLGVGLVLLALTLGRQRGVAWPVRLGPRAAVVVLIGAVGFTIGPALGTANAVDMNAMMTMVPSFAGLLLMVELACRAALPRWLGRAILVSVAVLAAVQTSTAIQSPARQNTGILAQTEWVELGGRRDHLKVDAATAEFLRHASSALAGGGFKPGGDLIALVAMPGLVYALGGRSPAASWYYSWGPGAKRYNERILSLIDPNRLRRAFLLLTPSETSSLPDLGRFGIELGEDRALCAEITWPVTRNAVQIWTGSAASR